MYGALQTTADLRTMTHTTKCTGSSQSPTAVVQEVLVVRPGRRQEDTVFCRPLAERHRKRVSPNGGGDAPASYSIPRDLLVVSVRPRRTQSLVGNSMGRRDTWCDAARVHFKMTVVSLRRSR